jgi:hypothetical protein
VIRDEEFRGAGGERTDVRALLRKIDAVAGRFESLDRVCFYGQLAELLRERGGEIKDSDEMLRRASEETERQQSAWAGVRRTFFSVGELRVTARVGVRRREIRPSRW